jgi:predicted solute-binding protein
MGVEMQLAVWNYPPAEFMVSGITSGAVAAPFSLERHPPRVCVELLLSGRVDVALVPSLTVLTRTDDFDVLPGAALSTWDYPYARLVLRHGLERVEQVAFDPAYAQEALVARILLQEHYGARPAFVPVREASVRRLLAAVEDGRLLVGTEAAAVQVDELVLDVGQEWYELSNYPMVWGLFAVRKGEAEPSMVPALTEAVKAAEDQRRLWVRAQETSPALHAFFTDNLRLRLDDLAVASLTEFRQYLYYYQVTEDVPDLPLYVLPDGEPPDGARPML